MLAPLLSSSAFQSRGHADVLNCSVGGGPAWLQYVYVCVCALGGSHFPPHTHALQISTDARMPMLARTEAPLLLVHATSLKSSLKWLIVGRRPTLPKAASRSRRRSEGGQEAERPLAVMRKKGKAYTCVNVARTKALQ